MSSFSVEKQAAKIVPAMQGATVAVNCSTTMQVLDLTTFPVNPATAPGGAPLADKTVIGKFITITADGGSVYYTVGNNFAAINAIVNTVVFSTVNATTGKITVNGNELDLVPAGTWKDVVIMASVPTDANGNLRPGLPQTQSPLGANSTCRYLGVIASSGNPVARIRQSSD